MNIELKPIAEKKVRQMGGDVCGVLVRTDGGVMAVSEHGRCTRLDAGVMGPVETETRESLFSERDLFLMKEAMNAGQYYESLEDWLGEVISDGGHTVEQYLAHDADQKQADRAQGGQGAEVVAWECSGQPGLYDNITRSKGEADHHRKIGRTVRPLVYGDTHPQPAQQGSVPEFDYDHPTYCEIIERVAEATHRLLIAAGHDAETVLDMDEALEANIYKNIDMVALELEGTQQGSVPHWKELEALADEYVEGYEFRGDEGDYQPTEQERFLIQDCVAGLMDEVHQMLKRATPQPEADGWIECSERLPTEADADFRDDVWVNDKAMRNPKYQQCLARWNTVRDIADYTHWMPTGLKRPQPPKEGE